MKVEYEKEADLLAIELEAVDEVDHGERVDGGAIVHVVDGRPVIIDVPSASKGLKLKLRSVASRYDLDADELIAGADIALANPDRAAIFELLN